MIVKDIHIALAQGHWTGDQESTKALYRKLVAEAAATGARLICLPEFSILPYFPGLRDPAGFRWAEPLRGGECDHFFGELARAHGVYIIGSLFEIDADGKYWDTATIHGDEGALRYFTRKVHIPSGEGYHETDYFAGAGELSGARCRRAQAGRAHLLRSVVSRTRADLRAGRRRIHLLSDGDWLRADRDKLRFGRCLVYGNARPCGRERRLYRRLQSHRA